jgi:hypothetical protein
MAEPAELACALVTGTNPARLVAAVRFRSAVHCHERRARVTASSIAARPPEGARHRTSVRRCVPESAGTRTAPPKAGPVSDVSRDHQTLLPSGCSRRAWCLARFRGARSVFY